MANQMIALNARGPQLPDIGAVTARMGNVMANISTAREKQAAVERANQFRTLVSSPDFDPYNPESIKQAQAIDPAGTEKLVAGSDARRKANLEYIGGLTKQARDVLAIIDPADQASYAALRDEIVKQVPGWGERLPLPEQWNANTKTRVLMQADDVISKTIPTPTASAQMDAEGNMFGVTVGGLNPPTAQKVIVTDGNAPAGGPTLPPAPRADRVEAAAQAVARGAGVNDPALKDLTPDEFNQAQLRAANEFLKKPIAAEAGSGLPPLTMENAQQIIQTALQNGSMDQTHVDQLRQLVGPENAPGIDQWLQQNGVQVAPAGMPGMRSAVYRPQAQDFGPAVADDGMSFGGPQTPMGQQIVNEPGTQFRGKPPMQSPMPGSAIVPIPRVRAEAQAQRETPAEAAARARAVKEAEAGATRSVEEQKKLPGKQQVSKIISKLRNAYEALEKAQAIPSERRNAFANMFDYAATSTLGREAQKMFGTSSSKYLTEITSSRKLLATAIKNATGMSAQEMNSNTELQLMLDALTDPTQGIEAARSMLGTLEELYGVNAKPAAAPKQGKKTTTRRTAGGVSVSDW